MSVGDQDARIILIAALQSDGGGGIERLVRSYRDALVIGGASASIISLRGSGRRAQATLAFNIMREVWRLRPTCLLLAHVALAPLIPLVRLASPKTRTVLLTYGQEVWTDSRGWRTRLGANRAHELIALSEYTANKLQRWELDVPVHVLYPPAPPLNDTRSVLRDRRSRPPTILTVARLEHNEQDKHVDWVIAALADMRGGGSDAVLRVVGQGSDLTRLAGLANAFGVEASVHFLGRISDNGLDREYRAADVFALPSTQEGFGLVYLEAMSYGLPVVGTRARAVPEVIDDGAGAGYLIEAGNIAQLSSILISLLETPDQCKRVGERGRELSQARFGALRFQERVASLFGLESRGESIH